MSWIWKKNKNKNVGVTRFFVVFQRVANFASFFVFFLLVYSYTVGIVVPQMHLMVGREGLQGRWFFRRRFPLVCGNIFFALSLWPVNQSRPEKTCQCAAHFAISLCAIYMLDSRWIRSHYFDTPKANSAWKMTGPANLPGPRSSVRGQSFNPVNRWKWLKSRQLVVCRGHCSNELFTCVHGRPSIVTPHSGKKSLIDHNTTRLQIIL